jgi:hypothetical protein
MSFFRAKQFLTPIVNTSLIRGSVPIARVDARRLLHNFQASSSTLRTRSLLQSQPRPMFLQQKMRFTSEARLLEVASKAEELIEAVHQVERKIEIVEDRAMRRRHTLTYVHLLVPIISAMLLILADFVLRKQDRRQVQQ